MILTENGKTSVTHTVVPEKCRLSEDLVQVDIMIFRVEYVYRPRFSGGGRASDEFAGGPVGTE